MSTSVHHITLEQFIARPARDDDQREELIDGEVVLSPGPKANHSQFVRQI